MQSGAGSNTALFRSEQADEAHLPTIHDATQADSRISCPQPHRRWPCGAARAARSRAQAARGLVRSGACRIAASWRASASARIAGLRGTPDSRNCCAAACDAASWDSPYTARRAEGPARLGVMVTRKHAARATERNRLKRCIREAFRLEQAGLGPLDVLVRPPYGARASAAMLLRLRTLFTRLDQ